MSQRQLQGEELLLVVDEHDRPGAPLPRKQVHGDGTWHRVVHIWFVDGENILCQQRSLFKDNNPGFWEPFFGGHMQPGETYELAAARELKEELGITDPVQLQFWKTYKYFHPKGTNNEFIGIFIAHIHRDQEFRFEDNEVAQVAWKPISDVHDALDHRLPNWTLLGYEAQLLQEFLQT